MTFTRTHTGGGDAGGGRDGGGGAWGGEGGNGGVTSGDGGYGGIVVMYSSRGRTTKLMDCKYENSRADPKTLQLQSKYGSWRQS